MQHEANGDSSSKPDIAIVGAGIIGIACALTLSQKGLKVLVLDSQAPGMGASYGNAGHMATEQVFPIADASILMRLPAMLLDPMGPLRLDWRYLPRSLPWFTRLLWNLRRAPYNASVSGIRTLNQHSLDAWRRLLNSVDGRYLLKEDGSFLVYENKEAAAELEALRSRMDTQHVAVEHWHGDAIRGVAPQLSENIRGGLFFPDTAHVINPFQVVNMLAQAARANGVTFAQENIISGQVGSDGVILQAENSSRFSARKVLISCGAYSAPLTTALTGTKVPLDTERGYHLMLPNERDRLPVAVTSLERRFIMTPLDDGLRLAGTVEFAGLERPPNMERAWQLQKLSRGLFRSDLDTTEAQPWMGFRPSLPDSLPVIDSVKDGRVLLAFGHHHLGLTQAAVTAEIISHLAAHGAFQSAVSDQRIPDLLPYRLNRFS
ncbi:NAD(P)/FAD-dependent oxidoreductase [Marinobacter orientalis]|uniref:FAD-binding oxidoreductase n=1 Tax=Marinobacter orientalis TaxID=1928859 RepID=A0A7Y0RE38_9GAMM|nr:FAD-dependent oxidoreductase [Marinobacter orientalis]NMT64550.1 FAD-binding oxidoreductase [Marinobacter orientalis]TGX50498.1 FAD-binding oxidoreductase [Marinobacter orientalis]